MNSKTDRERLISWSRNWVLSQSTGTAPPVLMMAGQKGRKDMYTVELSKGNVKATIETVKTRKKKDAEEWLKEFLKLTTPGTTGKVVKVSRW